MSSSVPAVIPALKALAAATLPTGSQIWFGSLMPIRQSRPGNVSGVGSGVTFQIPAIHFDEDEYGELGPNYRHEEHYNIQCLLTAWSGAGPLGNYDQLLQDVYAEYAKLSVAVANNPTLGLTTPAPRLAWMRQLGVNPTPDANGFASVQIQFEIQVQARVTSLS